MRMLHCKSPLLSYGLPLLFHPCRIYGARAAVFQQSEIARHRFHHSERRSGSRICVLETHSAERPNTVLTSKIWSEDSTNNVSTDLHGFFKQFLPLGMKECLLRECKRSGCRPTSFISSRTSTIARKATNVGSDTSTWVRTCWTPLAICHFTVFVARDFTSSIDNNSLRSAQRSIPSNKAYQRCSS